jgi:hypothetical protein
MVGRQGDLWNWAPDNALEGVLKKQAGAEALADVTFYEAKDGKLAELFGGRWQSDFSTLVIVA